MSKEETHPQPRRIFPATPVETFFRSLRIVAPPGERVECPRCGAKVRRADPVRGCLGCSQIEST